MSNGNIITPLIPDENIEVNKETPETPKAPKDIYTPSNSPDNQKKESPKFYINSCCQKWNFLEITFLCFLFIIIFLIITSIIIQFVFKIIPMITIIYGSCPFFVLCFFWLMIQTQKYNNNGMILFILFLGILWCVVDFILSFFAIKSYKKIKEKNEFISNSLKFLKFGEISIWVLLICLFMSITYKRTGKICIRLPSK